MKDDVLIIGKGEDDDDSFFWEELLSNDEKDWRKEYLGLDPDKEVWEEKEGGSE
jgi:hypothetical protein